MAWTEALPPDRNGTVRHRGVYRLADGRKRRKTFDHKRAALRWASAEEQKVVDGSVHDPAQGRMTWAAWCEHWWPSRAMEPGFARSQLSLRTHYVMPQWGDTPLNKITHLDIQRWVNSLPKRLSASASRQAFYQLSASLKDAVRAGLLDHTPCVGIKLPTLPPAPERYFTEDEIERLSYRFDGVYRLLVEVLLDTGMRIGEAVALHRQRINLDAGTIDVVEKWDQYTRVVMAYPKGKRRRTVPLTDNLASRLRYWFAAHPDQGHCGFEHGRGSVCRSSLALVGPRGAVIDPKNFTNVKFKTALVDAGIGHARVHDLRHTYASRLVTAGVPLTHIQRLLGHESITTTERYAHLINDGHDMIRDALRRHDQGANEGANKAIDINAARQRRGARNAL